MEWTECLRGAIAYMEKNLLEDIGPADVAEAVHISPFYLQHGFRMVTGYTLGEYLRCRRLYLDTRISLEPAVSLYRVLGFQITFQQGLYIQMEKEL